MLKVCPNEEEFNRFAAERFIEIGKAAIAERGRFTVALSGGSTPKAIYRMLASETFRDKIEWKSVFFFFGDERNVAPDSEESNFKMANETLFEPLNIDKDKIYRWHTEIQTPEKIAEDYNDGIEYYFRSFPKFDLVLLGMGADGHTASLFPFSEALKETKKIAVANKIEKLETTRLTLTFPVINNARNVVFLVKGGNKAETLHAVLRGDFQPEKFPSQNVKPESGELFWLIDEAAARFL
ncbi:MAG TPA: 6-phosphogluconolactonase [Pyrinomonadaceae bacterium]|jgi:6-phosphogluconolactonase